MKKVIHTAESRGFFDHGWLQTYHTFSFAKYNNPQRMNFGALRVLNDDILVGGKGFGKHHHDNMEIISIPLSGSLAHDDNTGHQGILKPGDIQVMTAGNGMVHSEFNGSQNEEAHFLQIWIFPIQEGLEPRYDQQSFDIKDRQNKIQTFISPDRNETDLQIKQRAYLSWARLDKDFSVNYTLNDPANGVYVFIIDGSVFADEQPLRKHDGMGLWEISETKIQSIAHSEILFIEVPMS